VHLRIVTLERKEKRRLQNPEEDGDMFNILTPKPEQGEEAQSAPSPQLTKEEVS
jgi:hypothetical protein